MKKADAIDMQGHVSAALKHFSGMVSELHEINKQYPMPEGTRIHLMAVSDDLAKLRTVIWDAYMRATE